MVFRPPPRAPGASGAGSDPGLTTPEARLSHGLAALGLSPDSSLAPRLLAYLALLAKWNRAYNLTAVEDPLEQVTRHLLDSLAVLPYLPPGHVLDVGSGAGLPGIPLALAAPRRQFQLLDSGLKKTRFLTQVVAELALTNVTVVRERVEDFRPALPPEVIIARAFAPLDRLLEALRHLCRPGVVVLAMKGIYPGADEPPLPAGFALSETHSLQVPGLAAQRHLLRIEPR
ncbi:MAG: 16S rRNA (guanine(527)-N(7))-methyltransferase RsmG [Chromatiales bacterium 21-64-14]|nr:MAG: 16S rRNA (guanine(527)-N(7))-methyltransferase RsmG [Chromatiales bacterium 21-64-14]HQU16232.1 16S rRNA (guanine(527)-N(7))-methyltransferase RsmG [Gammaproteobacteria bacterium]